MTKKQEPPKLGRPKKELDLDQFKQWAALGSPVVEIADFFKMSDDTLRRRVEELSGESFAAVLKEARAHGNMQIRAVQHKKAVEGDSVMLKWVGMNRLGQSDRAINVEMQLQQPAIIERLTGEIIELGKLRRDEFNVDSGRGGFELDAQGGSVSLDNDAQGDQSGRS